MFVVVVDVVVVVVDVVVEMGAWWKTIEPQKPGNSPEPGPETVERRFTCASLLKPLAGGFELYVFRPP